MIWEILFGDRNTPIWEKYLDVRNTIIRYRI
jgi:hypothetical protein